MSTDRYFRLSIRTETAAFADDETAEVVRILRDVADRLEADPITPTSDGRMLRDINGNTVGMWEVDR